ncbi:MAG: tyrosine-type recombinase/integrase [Lachnospiraceae bacterium]|nr:tyrosine-type recombinase/integrase [Lachnospiraceae bacterium]
MWSDVSEDEIFVHRTETTWVDENHHTHCEVRNLPKTKAGKRYVPIPAAGMWLVAELRKLNPDGDYVFMLDGSRTRAVYFRKALYKACDAVNIPRRSPHKIRKTYASILLDNGVPSKAIIENMGHTSINTTNGSYSRMRKSSKQRQDIVNNIPEFAPISKLS